MKAFIFHGIVLMIIASPFTGIAQELNNVDSQENLFKIGGLDASYGVVRRFDNRYEGVEGSPFYFDYWANGSIYLESGEQLINLKLKYNAYEDELIINRGKAGFYYFPKDNIQSFSIENSKTTETIHFKKLDHLKKKDKQQFYQVLVEGELSLLKSVKVVFEKANYEGGYSNDKRYDEFKKYTSFYSASLSSHVPQKLKSNPAGVTKVFPRHNDEIKQYIHENKLDCRTETALITIFNYYYSFK